jgi:hypothetical protein
VFGKTLDGARRWFWARDVLLAPVVTAQAIVFSAGGT